jgi:hypothetical protein
VGNLPVGGWDEKPQLHKSKYMPRKKKAAGRVQPPNRRVALKSATPTDVKVWNYFFFLAFFFVAFFAFFAMVWLLC